MNWDSSLSLSNFKNAPVWKSSHQVRTLETSFSKQVQGDEFQASLRKLQEEIVSVHFGGSIIQNLQDEMRRSLKLKLLIFVYSSIQAEMLDLKNQQSQNPNTWKNIRVKLWQKSN